MPTIPRFLAAQAAAALCVGVTTLTAAQSAGPSVVDPALAVRTVVAGLEQPIHLAFLGPDDFLVLEKASGQVKRVVNGVVQSTVLDLAVNSGSERGLLSIAGTRSNTLPQGDAKAAVHINERFEGSFRRVLTLPDDADPDAVQAKYRDGVLHITVQRRASSQPRRITGQ